MSELSYPRFKRNNGIILCFQIRKWKKKNGSPFQKNRVTPFTMFAVDVRQSGLKKSKKWNKKTGRSKCAAATCHRWINADSETLERLVYVRYGGLVFGDLYHFEQQADIGA